MKKCFLIAALFAAFTMNAKEIVIDLSTAVSELTSEADQATFSLEEGVLTVNWVASAGWNEQGVAFPLNNLEKVTNISYEYKGDGVADFGEEGVCLFPRLRDAEWNRWYKNDYYPNVKETEWQTEAMLPDNCPWDGATYAFGEKPFISLAFVVNPGKAGSGTFYLRNVVLTVEEESAVTNVEAQEKAVKEIRDGKMVIMRGGKCFNALGTEMK